MLRQAARRAVALRASQRAVSPLTRLTFGGVASPAFAQCVFPNGRSLSSRRGQSPDALTVGGVALQELARRSRHELQAELGEGKLRKVRQGLPRQWKALVNSGTVSPAQISQVFLAATKCQLPKLMAETFDYANEQYPDRVNYIMYGEMFNQLTRTGKADEILRIYESVKDRFDDENPAPEIIYRYGIYAKLGQQDFEGVQALVEGMKKQGIEVSNEVASRIMVGVAKAGDEESVVEIAQTLDAQSGRWHPADVDRVITSLGLVNRADEAFEFYKESQVKLSGNTLVALLNVCELNDRPRHAMAVIANRTRFNLTLNTRQLNRIMESLEFFDEREGIQDILHEMVNKNVPFDATTNAIIARNQSALKGSRFALSASEGWKPRSRQLDEPLVREFLASDSMSDAAAIIDAYSQSVDASDEERRENHGRVKDAVTVPAWLAEPAVVAYASVGERAKLLALLRGFSTVKGNFIRALIKALKHASVQHDAPVLYHAYKAMQFQGHDINHVKEAIDCFQGFQDSEAALALYRQAARQLAQAAREQDKDGATAKRGVPFDRVHVFNSTVQLLVQNNDVHSVVDVLDMTAKSGVELGWRDYTVIFNFIRAHSRESKTPYGAADFALIWTDMERRGVKPTKNVIGHVCTAFKGKETSPFEQAVLNAYLEIIREHPEDSYVMPLACYYMLLDIAAKSGSIEDVHDIYSDALKNLGKITAGGKKNQNRTIQRDWTSVYVSKMATDGDVEGAFELVTAAPRDGGVQPSYDAIMAVLRVLAHTGKDNEKSSALIARICERKFPVNLNHVEELVRVAIDHDNLDLALNALDLVADLGITQSEKEPRDDDFSAAEDEQDSSEGSSHVASQELSSRRSARRVLGLTHKVLGLCKAKGDPTHEHALSERIQALELRVQQRSEQ